MPAYAPPPVEVVMPTQAQPGGQVQQQDADLALALIRATLPKTKFIRAWPSVVPGLIGLKLENGQIAYTDKSARYFILGVVLDTATGQGLDGQMDPVTSQN